MRAWLLALLAGGCGFQSAAGPGPGGDIMQPPGDAGTADTPTGDIDAGTAHVCLGAFIEICVDASRSSLTLMTQTIDTSDTSATSKCLPYTAKPAVDACVIAAQSIAIATGNTVSVTGARRLILLASDAVSVPGTLDASSRRGGRIGPAADTGPCPTSTVDPTVSGQGGGGFGGTFGTAGSDGGDTPGGGNGGIAGDPLPIDTLGGGCRGSKGGSNNGGDGGHGGGAVLIIAGHTITVAGSINASGAGGSGGKSPGGGGGGGGAGGTIALDAPTITVPGSCFANGGGGGEAASSLVNGDPGGESKSRTSGASGGHGATGIGGDGGDGATPDDDPTSGGNGNSVPIPPFGFDTGGGGAGGGGLGIIKLVTGS